MQAKEFRKTVNFKPIRLHANQSGSLIYAVQAALKSEADGTLYIVPTVYGLNIRLQKPLCGTPFYAVTDRELSQYCYRHELVRVKQF